ncbi:trypsin-like serine protease [Streptomyces sp. SID5643]|uniref:trypsin-like serine protease n=1 Tax=Streptomyces sp. SID5643 TaxID=2690307 RepID=UPI00136C70DC|nr:trypsin-like serine protease [Streptomyces sp. SID5643]MZF89346.1 trypsin-like serine protease [Streptomyces sp. SID5643]
MAAIGLAAAVAATVMPSSAGAATALPAAPAVEPAIGSPSPAALEKRIAGALTGGGASGGTTEKSSLSSGTAPSTIDPKIIGGTETTLSSAPWMAQLWYHDDRDTPETGDDVSFFCGGAVVAPTKILTAAHCLRNDNRDYNWQAHGAVVTGTAQLPTTDSSGATDLHGGTATAVQRQWWQWGYDPVDREVAKYESDLGMLTLAVPVKATPIRMVTHGDTASYAAGTQAKLYGWGRTTSTGQDLSPTLRTATLTLRSDSTCSGVYDTAFAPGRMVCAGTQSGTDTGTTAACNGDSGGPLIVGGRIAGVVSWGTKDCVTQGYYSVFTRMSAYAGSAYRQIDDTNLSTFNGRPDGKADLFVRNSSMKTAYEKDSSGTSFGTRVSWGNWSATNLILQTDLNRDGYQDLIYRVGSTGDVYWKHFVLNSARTGGSWTDTRIATAWKTRTRIIVPGDVTGDYLPDLLSVDSNGTLWTYPGKGDGTFGSRFSVRTGWNQYNSVRGHGDLTGDGRADLLARQAGTGDLYLYKGTGKTGSEAFSPRIKVRSAWTGYNAFDAVGDVSGDGNADFLARTPGGTLYLYKGTGKATSEIFAPRVSVGTGFQQYDIWG